MPASRYCLPEKALVKVTRAVNECTLIDVICIYSKTCLKQPLKMDKTKVLKTNGSLMKVKSIAECSLGAFCNTFDLH